jgi:hypothetical protein
MNVFPVFTDRLKIKRLYLAAHNPVQFRGSQQQFQGKLFKHSIAVAFNFASIFGFI